ncbi:tetratricopeptide repeat protein [Cognataquiflexum rubidum]|uniref:tetratricopeptide repeat protein n=1 Tax=Cognataquiflexum rubidum TaxID=2922273 RepID=UPI001F1479A6|nr:hypothetical protein [Cognataquiflexum rubidum]MCH6234186.1 hypothetical protein [Cognataquiflexum rubidum]
MESKWKERFESKCIEVFEEYLNDKLNEQERRNFEAELKLDKDLENSFLIYKAIEQDLGNNIKNKSKENELRKTLESLSKQYSEAPIKTSFKKQNRVIKFIGFVSAVAASFLLIFFVYENFYLDKYDSQRIAQNYFQSELGQLGQTMGNVEDSLQLGIVSYNQKDFFQAIIIFESILESDPDNSEAIKNLGLSYLGLEEFDKAIQQFQRLSQLENLYANPGLFYQALALLLRNEIRDNDQAKLLLEIVIDQNQEGTKKAKEWLEKL